MGFVIETVGLAAKKWGMEEVFVNNSMYCGKRMTVMPGVACSIHYHTDKVETFVVLDGRLILEIYEEVSLMAPKRRRLLECRPLLPGRPLTILKHTPHRFWAEHAPVRFLEFSSHDSLDDSIRITKAGPVTWKYSLGGPW
jgi:mannose-6-phosphate isomerase-like protein (cupin superfamily)